MSIVKSEHPELLIGLRYVLLHTINDARTLGEVLSLTLTASSPEGFDLPPIHHTVRAIYVFMKSIYTYAVIRGLIRRRRRSHLCKHLSGLSVTHITVNNQLSHCTLPHNLKRQRRRESQRSSQSGRNVFP